MGRAVRAKRTKAALEIMGRKVLRLRQLEYNILCGRVNISLASITSRLLDDFYFYHWQLGQSVYDYSLIAQFQI